MNQVQPGSCVLFNGASLLDEQDTDVIARGHLADHHSRRIHQRLSTMALSLKGDRTQKAQVAFESDALVPEQVNLESWRRYCTLIEVFKVFGERGRMFSSLSDVHRHCLAGGIYVQEPDCCPASVDALVQLVNAHPGHFPLGFAYGHLGAKVVAVAGHKGRGMAGQAILEEFSSRKKLNKNVSRERNTN